MTQQAKARISIDIFVAAKLAGSALILFSGITAFWLRGAVEEIAEARADSTIRYALVPLKDGATDAEKKEQMERIKWNHISSKVDEIYMITDRSSFIDQYSDKPVLFWATALGGFLLLVGEAEGLWKKE